MMSVGSLSYHSMARYQRLVLTGLREGLRCRHPVQSGNPPVGTVGLVLKTCPGDAEGCGVARSCCLLHNGKLLLDREAAHAYGASGTRRNVDPIPCALCTSPGLGLDDLGGSS